MSQTTVDPEDYALNALNAITREDSEAARQHIGSLDFRGRALLVAWAGELLRLTQDEQSHCELLERRATRERREMEVEVAASRKALRTLIRCLYEEPSPEAPTVNAASFPEIRQSRSWIVGELKGLTDEGVLKPVADRPGQYVVLKTPDGNGTPRL
jgi:hypothetical protein